MSGEPMQDFASLLWFVGLDDGIGGERVVDDEKENMRRKGAK